MKTLTAARAARLASTAATGPDRGVLARRAWRLLLAAGDAGDREAIDAVWHQWLREPRQDAFDALRRWRPGFVREVCSLAVSPTVGPASRARMAAICVEQGIAPDDAAERVVFHLLTGQFEKVHDSDPALLAEGYQTADPALRAMLRDALAADGDFDLPGFSARTTSPTTRPDSSPATSPRPATGTACGGSPRNCRCARRSRPCAGSTTGAPTTRRGGRCSRGWPAATLT
ncbi:hypothetical protein [Dactylosporangium cerinum]